MELPKPSMQCFLCAKPGFSEGICPGCSKASHIASIQVATVYNGTAKELVHKMKFERAQAAAKVMAEALLPLLPTAHLLCPVPTATSRVRQRGYDQSELLVKRLAAKSGQNTASLLKRQQQSRQVGLGRTQRHKQMSAAFRPAPLARTLHEPVVLIDDVITTVATMHAAARTLHEAGLQTIHVRAFAFTPVI